VLDCRLAHTQYCADSMGRAINILIGLTALVGIAWWVIKRPQKDLRNWVVSHQSLIEAVAPVVFVVWGGVIWCLVIVKHDYSNIPPMVAASLLICTGIFFFFWNSRGG
jgi:hypothetical protein